MYSVGEIAYQELKKKKNEPTTCNHALSPPFGGGLTDGAAAACSSPVPFGELKVEEGGPVGRSTFSPFAVPGTIFPVIARLND